MRLKAEDQLMAKWKNTKEYKRKPISAVGIFSFSEEKSRSFPEAAGGNNCESLPDNLQHKSLERNDNQRNALYSLTGYICFPIRNHSAAVRILQIIPYARQLMNGI